MRQTFHVRVPVPEFCPQSCPVFEVRQEEKRYCAEDNTVWFEQEYSCKHEDMCCRLYHNIMRARD